MATLQMFLLIRYTLLIRLPIATLDPENIECGISKMLKNVLRHGKRLRKELLKSVLETRNILQAILLKEADFMHNRVL